MFISYVREDALHVDRLQRTLEAAGIRVWRDTADLWPGQDWRINVRRAITDGALVFLACFSRQSVGRRHSYQNEELMLAIEQLRQKSPDDGWLIPIRFDECDIPDREIGGGRTLSSIQQADLFGEHADESSKRLIAVIQRKLDSPAGPSGEAQQTSGGPGANDASADRRSADFTLWVDLEKRPGVGEDAPPLIYWPPGSGPSILLVAVFDGVGGAGGELPGTSNGRRSGAYIASRVARDALESCTPLLHSVRGESSISEAERYISYHGPAMSMDEITGRIADTIRHRLEQEATITGAVGGRLSKPLPTTMAAAWCDVNRGEVTSLSAGSSRTYLLTTANGLQQISTDDLVNGADAQKELQEDCPISNFLNANGDFTIQRRTIRIKPPFVLLAVTDGCFGYLRTPQHFEHMLLSTLHDSNSAGEWRTALKERISAVTGDDSTLAGVIVGWRNIGEMRLDFRARYYFCAEQVRYIDQKYTAVSTLTHQVSRMEARLDAATEDRNSSVQFSQMEAQLDAARENLNSAVQELWDQYKPTYYALQNSTRAQRGVPSSSNGRDHSNRHGSC